MDEARRISKSKQNRFSALLIFRGCKSIRCLSGSSLRNDFLNICPFGMSFPKERSCLSVLVVILLNVDKIHV